MSVLHCGPWKCATWYSFITLTNVDHFWNVSLFDSAVNLPQGSCPISHHTGNLSSHYLVESIISKIAKFWRIEHNITILPYFFNKISQINLIVCVLLSHIKCYNVFLWHGCMHGNICDTRQVHDVDELKQRLTKVWHGLGQCHRWCNVWVTQTSLGMCLCQRRAFWTFNMIKSRHMVMFRSKSMLLH